MNSLRAARTLSVSIAAPAQAVYAFVVVTPLAGGPAVDVPLRVVPNGPGSEVLLTLFQQSGMSDAQYDAGAALIRADLAAAQDGCRARARRSGLPSGAAERARASWWRTLGDVWTRLRTLGILARSQLSVERLR